LALLIRGQNRSYDGHPTDKQLHYGRAVQVSMMNGLKSGKQVSENQAYATLSYGYAGSAFPMAAAVPSSYVAALAWDV